MHLICVKLTKCVHLELDADSMRYMFDSLSFWVYLLYLKGEMLRIYSNQLLSIFPMTAPYVCVSRDHIWRGHVTVSLMDV